MTLDAPFSTITEKEFWRSNKKHSITVNRSKLCRLMGISIREMGSISTAHCRHWIYSIGIKPDEFMVKKSGYDQFPSSRHSMGFGEDIEFRFTEEAYSFAKLSGLFDEIQTR